MRKINNYECPHCGSLNVEVQGHENRRNQICQLCICGDCENYFSFLYEVIGVNPDPRFPEGV